MEIVRWARSLERTVLARHFPGVRDRSGEGGRALPRVRNRSREGDRAPPRFRRGSGRKKRRRMSGKVGGKRRTGNTCINRYPTGRAVGGKLHLLDPPSGSRPSPPGGRLQGQGKSRMIRDRRRETTKFTKRHEAGKPLVSFVNFVVPLHVARSRSGKWGGRLKSVGKFRECGASDGEPLKLASPLIGMVEGKSRSSDPGRK